jgi:hypothetical protein
VSPEAAQRPAPVLRWVDGAALPDGDGSEAHPWKALPAQLPPGAVLHVRSGLYAGPVTFRGVTVVGEGMVVLFSQDAAATVVEASDATLSGLQVQGGRVGLSVEGQVSATGVGFSGQRGEAIHVSPGASFALSGATLDGTIPNTRGLVSEGASLQLTRLTLTGGFTRGVSAQGGALRAEGLSSTGPATALHLSDVEATVTDVLARGGRGPALFTTKGHLTLRHAQVEGHEYGLLSREARLDVEDLTVTRPLLGAVAVNGCHAVGTRWRLTQTLGPAALQAEQSELSLGELLVRDASSLGLLVRGGRFEVTTLEVDGVRSNPDGSEGDGLLLRDTQATLGRVQVRRVDGVGLWASAGARVKAVALSVERASGGSVVVEREARLDAETVQAQALRGPAVTVAEGGQLEVGALQVTGTGAPLWVECREGAHARVRRLTSPTPVRATQCVEVP